LTWVDRTGAVVGTIGSPGRRRFFDLSPDETRVAVSQFDPRGRQTDIWLIDVAGSGRTRITAEPSDEVEVVWSPDGQQLIFASSRRGPVNLYMKAVSGGGSEQLLFESPLYDIPWQWSDTGPFVFFTRSDPKSGTDLWLSPTTGDGPPRPLTRTKFAENYPQLSRDGRWLAYTSDESGANEIYVQPFPSSGSQWQVSSAGGTEPRWRADGKELYYISASQKLMAVEVKTGAGFDGGTPAELFQMPGRNAGETTGYAVSRDGRRFLLDRVIEQTGAAITVVLDWQQRLK
jgi:Tol biopolymer transport system component